MNKKVVVIGILAITILAAVGAFFYSHNNKPLKTSFYQDRLNEVGFNNPDGWFVSPSAGYIRVTENQADTTKPSVLIKTQDLDSTIDALGLDKAQEVKIGDKTMRRLDREVQLPAVPNRPVTKTTSTQLLWFAPNGRSVIFEITPWQKPAFDSGMKELISSFKTL